MIRTPAEKARARLTDIRERLDLLVSLAMPYFNNDDTEGRFAVEVVGILQNVRECEMDVDEFIDSAEDDMRRKLRSAEDELTALRLVKS
jgi:hypothetical protein